LDQRLVIVLEDLLARWQKPNGSFRGRELLVGWDNVPMHRWAQSQLFRSLCCFLARVAEVRKENESLSPAKDSSDSTFATI
jgi:hypothetical protein